MICRKDALPLTRQCRILKLSRSSVYYKPAPISERDLELMRRIDEIHLQYPFFGSRRVRKELETLGHPVGRGHVSFLMRKMRIQAIYRKPRLSTPNWGHEIYPYLLRGVDVDRANQVWATDITYIPMRKGFCYLVAIMDWHSRKVLAWQLSNTMDVSFCVDALEAAIEKFGVPDIFNTDQGSQFTSDAFTGTLKANDIRISMDGKGRWMDNVFVERLWRSVKYEDVYLKGYDSMETLRLGLGAYFNFYNKRRHHQGLAVHQNRRSLTPQNRHLVRVA